MNDRDDAEIAVKPLRWRPIETAPKTGNIIAKFWHGQVQVIVEAAPRGDGGWQDVADESCVGWLPGGKPGFWLCGTDQEPQLKLDATEKLWERA